MSRPIRLAAATACLLAPLLARAADAWQPVPGTLQTRTAAQVSPTNAHPEYPRPQLVRRDWLNLNGLWDCALLAADAPVPTNFSARILVPFPVESALSGVGQRLWETNCLWYRRSVTIPEAWKDRQVRLHFGAVDWYARVFVNGREAGQHRGGYDRFSVNITPYLNWTQNEEIVVAVMDPTEGEQPRGKQSRKPEGIFYTPSSGIWQTVWLEPVPRACIDDLRVSCDLTRNVLRLNVLANRLDNAFRAEAVALQNGTPVARAAGPLNQEIELQLENPHLWSPADPFLYDLRVTIFQDQTPVDEVQSYFGFRELAVRKNRDGSPGLALNGGFLFQVGVLDQGFWPEGLYTAPTDAALQEELQLLKRLGFNTVRKHVKVEPDRWYYWCDRLGLLVWQDMPSGNNLTAKARNQFEIELQRMVESLWNHPSVVLWVLFNEGWGQYDTSRLAAWLKRLDPSRPVTAASGWIDKQVGDVADVHSYPGPEAPAPESSRAAVLGEFGGVGLSVENHVWSPKIWGYEVVANSEQLTARYEDLLTRVWTLKDTAGLSAVIYTQLSDVETECNGLVTYDRAVLKMDEAAVRAANLGETRERLTRLLVPPGGYGRTVWRYTTALPGPNWHLRPFDPVRWLRGAAGFGAPSPSIPADATRTLWKSAEIWLRTPFELASTNLPGIDLRARYAGDVEVFLNGVLAASVGGESRAYVSLPVTPEAAAALRAGLNVLAVHARRSGTNQFVDVGLVGRPTTNSVSQP
jgi:hypothetical protein